MFDIAPTELLIVAIVALVVIGPKDLPGVMRTVGHWAGRARGMARHFRSGIDTMMREAELEEMEKKWREENERIMRDHPMLPSHGNPPDYDHPGMLPVEETDQPPREENAPSPPSTGSDGPLPRSGEDLG